MQEMLFSPEASLHLHVFDAALRLSHLLGLGSAVQNALSHRITHYPGLDNDFLAAQPAAVSALRRDTRAGHLASSCHRHKHSLKENFKIHTN